MVDGLMRVQGYLDDHPLLAGDPKAQKKYDGTNRWLYHVQAGWQNIGHAWAAE